MVKLVILVLSLLLMHKETMVDLAYGSSKEEEEAFFKKCPPSRCGTGQPEVRFPYRLSSQPSQCGAAGMELTCSGNKTILNHPTAGPCKVQTIDYVRGEITVELPKPVSLCPVQNLTSIHLTTALYSPYLTITMILVQCSRAQMSHGYALPFPSGPVPCLTDSSQVGYMIDGRSDTSSLPSFCTVLSNNLMMPRVRDEFDNGPTELGQGIGVNLNVTLLWSGSKECQKCEAAGKQCSATKSFCTQRTSAKVIAGMTEKNSNQRMTAIGVVAFLLVAGIVCYLYRKWKMDDYLKHEQLLAKYNKKLTRYSFSEIKKITKHFKDKLGQGGFGTVYKGELPDGILVAIKVIEKSNTDGKDFINEVSTIGNIHHFNVVRLLGFCAEGNRRALVYEFMPNGSLDKFISTEVDNGTKGDNETMLKIMKGVASGIRYLHEGCNLQILHFDIKPHNVLLDHNLNPKVSDFGLAKLCSKDVTSIAVTAAKGTIGYMAPEVYSRNFGNVSYKSDVYSFGMLILKTVVGEKRLEPDMETGQSDVYYPELIYEKLVNKKDIESAMEVAINDEITKKLIIVAFWCIQWNPAERPSMSKVVQMLDCDLENLEIPPKPFL